MTRQCCKAAAPILPGAAILLLPKCPLCLAAGLTLVTGVSFTADGAAQLRGILVALWVVAAALSWRQIVSGRRGEQSQLASPQPQATIARPAEPRQDGAVP